MAAPTTERSLAEVVQAILGNIQDIFRSEFRLARTELTDQAKKARSAMPLLGAGALAGLFSATLLLVTCVLALAMVLPAWLAALIMAAVTGIAAMVLIGVGRRELKDVSAKPRRTIQSVRENIEWAKQQTR